jgi:hypothetical protein
VYVEAILSYQQAYFNFKNASELEEIAQLLEI